MPALDTTNLKLLDAATLDATGNGPDFPISGLGLQAGPIIEAIMVVESTIDDTNMDETMQVFIEEKIGSNYRTIGVFPTIGSALDDNPDVDNAGKALKCYFRISAAATNIRYRTIEGGTTASLVDVNIYINPLRDFVPPDF